MTLIVLLLALAVIFTGIYEYAVIKKNADLEFTALYLAVALYCITILALIIHIVNNFIELKELLYF